MARPPSQITDLFDPDAAGDFSGANYLTWLINHLFFDLKMMAIFSMLFGAGIVLMTDRVREKTGRSMGVHYRRMEMLRGQTGWQRASDRRPPRGNERPNLA